MVYDHLEKLLRELVTLSRILVRMMNLLMMKWMVKLNLSVKMKNNYNYNVVMLYMQLFVQKQFCQYYFSMPEITPVEDEPPSWCLISLMVTFNAVVNQRDALCFLWVCFLRLKVSIKIHGALWIFVYCRFYVFMQINCWIDIIQFFVMLNFTFRHFNSTIPRKLLLLQCFIVRALTICSSLSFGIMLCLQLASLIVGSAKLRSWGHCTIQAFRPTYLVYIILSWCFLGALLIVILVCMCIS